VANVLYLRAEVSTAMTGFRKPRRFGKERRAIHEAEERWKKAGYSPSVIEKLDWDWRYSIVELGEDQYALSSYENYVATLRTAWELGYVPVHGPGAVRGIDLPSVAPRLRGGDVEELHLQDSLG
jgi:hypothetical protein